MKAAMKTTTNPTTNPTTKTIWLTGFEPFAGATINPSWEVARALHGQLIGGARVASVQLPCVFAQALPALQQALHAHRPRWVLALGLAGSRCAISVERVAVNLIDARIPDNAGAQPLDEPVLPGGPDLRVVGGRVDSPCFVFFHFALGTGSARFLHGAGAKPRRNAESERSPRRASEIPGARGPNQPIQPLAPTLSPGYWGEGASQPTATLRQLPGQPAIK